MAATDCSAIYGRRLVTSVGCIGKGGWPTLCGLKGGIPRPHGGWRSLPYGTLTIVNDIGRALSGAGLPRAASAPVAQSMLNPTIVWNDSHPANKKRPEELSVEPPGKGTGEKGEP